MWVWLDALQLWVQDREGRERTRGEEEEGRRKRGERRWNERDEDTASKDPFRKIYLQENMLRKFMGCQFRCGGGGVELPAAGALKGGGLLQVSPVQEVCHGSTTDLVSADISDPPARVSDGGPWHLYWLL